MAITFSEIRVQFHGENAGEGELTWGQLGIWRTTQRTGRTMNLAWPVPLPPGTPLAEMEAVLRFVVSRNPVLRTRLRFTDDPSGERHPRQVIAGSGEVTLHIADIADDDDPAAAAEELRSRYELTWYDYENEFPVRMGVIRQSGALVHMVCGYSHVMVDGAGLDALNGDLARLDRGTGEATTAPRAQSPLELAAEQGSPAGRRQSERSVRHWAAQVGRLSDWRLAEPAEPGRQGRADRPREARFAELVAYSPAMELGMRAVAARTGSGPTDVLLAAYSAAVARVFGRDPSVAQIVVGNRFRPALADLVLQVSQHGICVVDVADATFDQVVARAQKAGASASFYAYYDPAERDRMLDKTAARLGRPLDIDWCLNDRRGMFGPPVGDGELPTKAELTRVLPRTKLFWDREQPTADGTLFFQVDSQPLLPGRQWLREGLPATYLEVWADTHHFAPAQVESLVREMEAVVVAAAFDAQAVALVGDRVAESPLEVVAFFLPQFHPVPENDRWWGRGFTEWTHAARARPLFDGHLQPRLPADLGFYDLRVPETRRAQWELAVRYGVTALCYWHYWFGDGIQLLTRPAMDLLEHPELPHRYCMGWANQTWTGVWHGRGDEVLQEQRYSGEADNIKHFNYLLPHFLDKRYLTVDGQPVFYFFRPGDIPDLRKLAALWQQMAVDAGLPGLYLVGDVAGTWTDDEDQPLEAGVWNPPPPPRGHEWEAWFPGVPLRESPRAFRYDMTFADWVRSGVSTAVRQHPCVVPGFDNTPRSGRRGILLHGLDPGVFETAVREAVRSERAMPGPRMMFIKSWNEWAEGAIMEPDQVFGHAFLRALERGLSSLTGLDCLVHYAASIGACRVSR